MTDHVHDADHPPDGGLELDLATTISRRRALQLFAGAGALTILGVGCGSGDGGSGATAATAAGTTSAAGTTTATGDDGGSCDTTIPQETAGPYPGDGSNGPNVLDKDGVVRQDITTSFAGLSGTAEGIALTVVLELLDANDGCTPLEGGASYLWHCDREGRYSLYSQGVTDQNYLRGLQAAGADGTVTFSTVFPGCYSGRWPHIHFEVYGSVADATGGGRPRATSQIALPKAICDAVYATSGYEQSVGNLSRLTLQSDNVFSDDGAVHQLARIAGDASSGVTATLTVPL